MQLTGHAPMLPSHVKFGGRIVVECIYIADGHLLFRLRWLVDYYPAAAVVVVAILATTAASALVEYPAAVGIYVHR